MTQTSFFKPPIVGVFCYLLLNAFLVDKKHSEKVFEPSPKGAGVTQEKKNEKNREQLKSDILSSEKKRSFFITVQKFLLKGLFLLLTF